MAQKKGIRRFNSKRIATVEELIAALHSSPGTAGVKVTERGVLVANGALRTLLPVAFQPSRTDWKRVDAMSDAEIDFSDIPEQGPEFFRHAKLHKGAA